MAMPPDYQNEHPRLTSSIYVVVFSATIFVTTVFTVSAAITNNYDTRDWYDTSQVYYEPLLPLDLPPARQRSNHSARRWQAWNAEAGCEGLVRGTLRFAASFAASCTSRHLALRALRPAHRKMRRPFHFSGRGPTFVPVSAASARFRFRIAQSRASTRAASSCRIRAISARMAIG